MELSRRSFFGAAGLAAAGSVIPANASTPKTPCGATAFSYSPTDKIHITVPSLKKDVRAFVVGDTHLGLHDSRDDEYKDYYKRMIGGGNPAKAFTETLEKAKKEKPDIILLVGDNLSFPTLANVEFFKRELDACGIEWFYVAGNHDWHFEGVPGSDEAQRDEWIEKRLKPLYNGQNPLMSSRLVNGIRFVAIDNSIYHVSEKQLEFWKREAAKGDPMVLFMHIPLWQEGWGKGGATTGGSIFRCGSPTWGAATDPYWEIERREKWAEKQSPSTFAFRETVLSTPNLAGVMTGHIHIFLAGSEIGKYMFTTPANRNGKYLDVVFSPN